jgi:putative transposase
MNKLDKPERAKILAVNNGPQYASMLPSPLVLTLLDKDIYRASEASFYRILKAHDQLRHRGRSKAPKKTGRPTNHTALGPNEI